METKKIVCGILGCGFECKELIDDVLAPWIHLKNDTNCPYKFIFSFVHGQFKEYVDLDGLKKPYVPDWAIEYKEHIDIFITPEPGTELELRNLALRPLIQAGCDLIYLLDLQDEVYKVSEIQKSLKFVDANPFICWFKGSFKNYVFDHKHYLSTPFTAARIYRVKYQEWRLGAFRHDNEMVYYKRSPDSLGRPENTIDHLQLPNLTIPKNICWVSHYTWPSNARGKSKYFYQVKRWGADLCSYKWNNEKNCLEFNPAYYIRTNQSVPEVIEGV